MTYRIGAGEACDAVAINGVVNAAYRVEDFFKAGDRTNVREIAELLLHQAFLIARDDGDDVVGAVCVSQEGDRGHFGMLSVSPEAQGSGLGRTLIEAAEVWAAERGCSWMDLEVASPRLELPGFYRRFGYEVSGRADWPEEALNELKYPAHFVVMSKRLG